MNDFGESNGKIQESVTEKSYHDYGDIFPISAHDDYDFGVHREAEWLLNSCARTL